MNIETTPLPEGALIARYADQGDYTDCFVATVSRQVTIAHFAEAFYTSPLFKVERFILRWVVRKPSTDSGARALALREVDHFAAWTVEGRADNQLLMCDYQSRTRSWLMVIPDGEAATRLYFGTVVVKVRSRLTGKPTLGPVFHALLWFHKLYARALLRAAVNRL
jgi:hypothetical protein